VQSISVFIRVLGRTDLIVHYIWARFGSARTETERLCVLSLVRPHRSTYSLLFFHFVAAGARSSPSMRRHFRHPLRSYAAALHLLPRRPLFPSSGRRPRERCAVPAVLGAGSSLVGRAPAGSFRRSPLLLFGRHLARAHRPPPLPRCLEEIYPRGK
jgi:hypothetical protein